MYYRPKYLIRHAQLGRQYPGTYYLGVRIDPRIITNCVAVSVITCRAPANVSALEIQVLE